MIGHSFSFTLAFEDNDKFLSTGSFNGMKTSELWVCVKNDSETGQLPGTYAGMFRDKYGIEWIVEFAPNDNGQN
jgi:hypothetical protein